jgi:hypothetical protein
MGQSSRKSGEQSAIAARNFSLTSEERVRAIAAGPPAHMRRLRAIEDLEEGIVRVLAQRYAEARAQKIDADAYALSKAPLRAIARLADLIERHNRWYPIEANLPMHPRTGELLDRTGLPWRPLAPRDLTQLLARARAAT